MPKQIVLMIGVIIASLSVLAQQANSGPENGIDKNSIQNSATEFDQKAISKDEWGTYFSDQPTNTTTDWMINKSTELIKESTKLIQSPNYAGNNKEIAARKLLAASSIMKYVVELSENSNDPDVEQLKANLKTIQDHLLQFGVDSRIASKSLDNLKFSLTPDSIQKSICTTIKANTNTRPISIAGISPGETSSDDLKKLISDPNALDGYFHVMGIRMERPEKDYYDVKLKCLDKKEAKAYIKNDVVYKVEIFLNQHNPKDQAINLALIEKYGKPTIRQGAIKKITCQNKLGASFLRFDGEERLSWKPSGGIQAYFQYFASCSEDIYQQYVIENSEMVQRLESEKRTKEFKELSDKAQKAKGRL